MNWRQVVAILANLTGVLVPVLTVVQLFGLDAVIQTNTPDGMRQILALGASVIFGFVCSLAAALLLKKGAPPTLSDLHETLRELHIELRAENGRHERPHRSAA